MKGCTGQCLVGAIVAIIFGSLFLYTLIMGLQTQWVDRGPAGAVIIQYIMAFIFLAITKLAKHHAYSCSHCEVKPMTKAVTKGKAKK